MEGWNTRGTMDPLQYTPVPRAALCCPVLPHRGEWEKQPKHLKPFISANNYFVGRHNLNLLSGPRAALVSERAIFFAARPGLHE